MIKDGRLVCNNCGEDLSPQPTAQELAKRQEDERAGRHTSEVHAGCVDPSGTIKLPLSRKR